MKKLLALLLVLMSLTAAASAETLRFYATNVPQALLDAHPGLTAIQSDFERDRSYETTSELAGALLTRSFGWDLLTVQTNRVDTDLLMEKGYLLDLSGSEIIRDAVSRMHPFIQQRCMHDGKIYAVPYSIELVRPDEQIASEVLDALGYTEADVPQTFPALLDFIERYLDRRDIEPDLDYCVVANLDDSYYHEHFYARYLTQLLVNSHITQSLYAGVPIRFNTPEFVALLNRTRNLADRIFTYEPIRRSPSDRTWPGILGSYTSLGEEYGISCRLSEDQPILRTAYVLLSAAYAGTPYPELAIEALEMSLPNIWDVAQTYIYTDVEPLMNPDFPSDNTHCLNIIALIEHRIAEDKTPWADYLDLTYGTFNYASFFDELWQGTVYEAQDKLEKWQRSLQRIARQQWYVSPEALAAYRATTDTLYLPGPSIFTDSAEGQQNFYTLQRQFSDGLISAEQFALEADRIAEMIELENQ